MLDKREEMEKSEKEELRLRALCFVVQYFFSSSASLSVQISQPLYTQIQEAEGASRRVVMTLRVNGSSLFMPTRCIFERRKALCDLDF